VTGEREHSARSGRHSAGQPTVVTRRGSDSASFQEKWQTLNLDRILRFQAALRLKFLSRRAIAGRQNAGESEQDARAPPTTECEQGDRDHHEFGSFGLIVLVLG